VSVRLRIFLGSLTIIAILGSVNLYSAMQLRGLDEASANIVEKTEIVRLVNDYVSAVTAQAQALRVYAYSEQDIDKEVVSINQDKAEENRSLIIRLLSNANNQAMAKQLETAALKFDNIFTNIENRLGNDQDALQVIVVGVGKLNQSSLKLGAFLKAKNDETAQQAAKKLPSIINRFTQHSVAYVASTKKIDFDKAIKAGEELEQIIRHSNQLLKLAPRKDRAVVRYVRRDADVVRQSLRQRNAIFLALNEAMAELALATTAIHDVTDSISRDTKDSQSQALQQMVTAVSSAIYDSFTGLAIGGAFSLLLAWVIGVSIAGPLSNITRAIAELAAGNKNVRVPYLNRKDEVGRMAAAADVFKEKTFEVERLAAEKMKSELEAAEMIRYREAEQAAMMEKKRTEDQANRAARQEIRLRQRLSMADKFERQVVGVVETVNGAAKDIALASRSLVANTQQTKMQMENTYTASSEASQSVNAVADSTEELAVSFKSVSDELEVSANVAREAVTEASRTTETVKGLTLAANQVGSIVKLIKDIAEQTNLLALNATIEAARAGDAGKGFAVVAQEVKNLAAQSSDATAEISKYVQEIQHVSADAGMAIGRISDIIIKIDDVTQSVVTVVNQQSSATQDIAANVQQLATGTDSMRESVSIVGSAAEETEGMSRNLNANADNLMKEAQALGREVHLFLNDVRSDKEDTEIDRIDASFDNVVQLKTA